MERLLASLPLEYVELWNQSPAQDPIIANGHISALKVRRNGKETSIYARKGIILASGGFGKSEESKDFVPHTCKWCAAPKGNTGDGKRIGVQSGGALPSKNPMNAVFAPIFLLQSPGKPTRRFPHFGMDRSKPGSIIIDENGQRFANESAPYQEFVAMMHEKGIKKAYYIANHTHLRKYSMGMALPAPYPLWLLRGRYPVAQASSLADLANKINVPVFNLQRTVELYNYFARYGKDLLFGHGESVHDRFYGGRTVGPNSNLRPCETGPFYALPLYPGNAQV